jgi:hypothetical protein
VEQLRVALAPQLIVHHTQLRVGERAPCNFEQLQFPAGLLLKAVGIIGEQHAQLAVAFGDLEGRRLRVNAEQRIKIEPTRHSLRKLRRAKFETTKPTAR